MAAAAAAAEGAAVNLTILLSFPHRDAAAGLRMGRGCTQGLWLTWLGTVTEDSWLQCQWTENRQHGGVEMKAPACNPIKNQCRWSPQTGSVHILSFEFEYSALSIQYSVLSIQLPPCGIMLVIHWFVFALYVHGCYQEASPLSCCCCSKCARKGHRQLASVVFYCCCCCCCWCEHPHLSLPNAAAPVPVLSSSRAQCCARCCSSSTSAK